MANIVRIPGKRRTRSHVIADLGVNFVERFILEAGFTAERVRFDYGYDLLVSTYDRRGYIETGHLKVQVKATERLKGVSGGRAFVFRLMTADVNLWCRESTPVLLILYEARTRRAYWLYIQRDVRTAKVRIRA